MESITQDELRSYVAQAMAVPAKDIDASEELYDHGMNSLQLVSVLTWLQDKGYDVSFADLAEDTRLKAWMALLETGA